MNDGVKSKAVIRSELIVKSVIAKSAFYIKANFQLIFVDKIHNK